MSQCNDQVVAAINIYSPFLVTNRAYVLQAQPGIMDIYRIKDRSRMTVGGYENLVLDTDKVLEVLIALGVDQLEEDRSNERRFVYTGSLQGERFHLQLFNKLNGKTTIGYTQGWNRPTFDVIAEKIKIECATGSSQPLNVALPLFKADDVDLLLTFLKGEGAKISVDQMENQYRLIRAKGSRHDKLTLKFYPSNSTLQIQEFTHTWVCWSWISLKTFCL
jgi:hypothetical protein